MGFGRHVRAALRNIHNAPGYSAAVIVTLALAIAANAAIFSAVYTVLLGPMPIRAAEDLVVAWRQDRQRNLTVVEVTYRDFTTWRSASSFGQVAAISSSNWPMVLDDQGHPTRLQAAAVSSSFFDTIGTSPFLGRTFAPADDAPNAPRVTVLTHGLWFDRFGGDPTIVGRTLRLDGAPYTVIGVMPRGLDFPRGSDLWIPVVPVLVASSVTWGGNALENVGVLYGVARLKPEVTLDAARDEMERLARPFWRSTDASLTMVATPFLDHLLGPVRRGLWWLLGAVAVLLLVACGNVSGLALTRAVARRRDTAIRLALGARLTGLARDAVIEAMTLAAIAGGAALLLSQWLLAGVRALAPDDLPRVSEIAINLPAAAFTGVVTAVAGLLCAVGPILLTRASSLAGALNDTRHVTPGRRWSSARSGLVVAQIALAIVLLVASGLVVRSFARLRAVDIGFDPVNVLTMQIEPRSVTEAERGSTAQPGVEPRRSNRWFEELSARVNGLPRVHAAGSVFLRPLAYGAIGTEASVLMEGQPETVEAALRNPRINHQVATPGYFRAMEIALVRGRLFDDRDRAGAPRVVVISERAATRLFPGQDAVGRRLSTPGFDPKAPPAVWHTVVGVVSNVHYRGINDPRLDVYEPAAQSYDPVQFLMVRTSGDPLALAGAVEARARELDPRAVVSGITTMEAVMAREQAAWRLSAWMFTLFAGFAFLLSVVGLVGVASLDVAQRRREYAVRLALGANGAHIRRRVLRQAIARAAAGAAAGLVLAAAVTRAMRSLLFEVDPLDAGTYALVVTAVAVVTIAASYLPASRAAAIDPAEVLKGE